MIDYYAVGFTLIGLGVYVYLTCKGIGFLYYGYQREAIKLMEKELDRGKK